MKKIELGGKRGAGKYALVDDEDYELVSQYRWHLSSGGYVRTAVNAETRAEAASQGRSWRRQERIFMHRLIMQLDDAKGLSVDHIDRNPLNNQRSNLRIANPSLQARNVGSNRYASSDYRGVCWKPRDGKWVAQGQYNGKVHWLGTFDDELAAARVVRTWRIDTYPDHHEPPLA